MQPYLMENHLDRPVVATCRQARGGSGASCGSNVVLGSRGALSAGTAAAKAAETAPNAAK
jgi:hypothetical protein